MEGVGSPYEIRKELHEYVHAFMEAGVSRRGISRRESIGIRTCPCRYVYKGSHPLSELPVRLFQSGYKILILSQGYMCIVLVLTAHNVCLVLVGISKLITDRGVRGVERFGPALNVPFQIIMFVIERTERENGCLCNSNRNIRVCCIFEKVNTIGLSEGENGSKFWTQKSVPDMPAMLLPFFFLVYMFGALIVFLRNT